MKMTKSRKPYTCHKCKGTIKKGDLYSKKTVRLGSSKPDEIANVNGVASIISHGITIAARHCAGCTQQKELAQ